MHTQYLATINHHACSPWGSTPRVRNGAWSPYSLTAISCGL